MKPITKLYEVLYVSTIAPGAPISVVADIAAKARLFNTGYDITGLLIFDGMRFCQQLEGSQKQVVALIERIITDTRHTDVTIFHNGELDVRRFKNFSLAFSNLDDVEALAKLEKLDGQSGVSAFVDLLPMLDLQA